MLISLWGCGGAKAPPVDEDVARSALQDALQAWVDGKKPEELRPEIYATDPAWEAGKKLVSFEILDNDNVAGGTVYLQVKRKFSTPDPTIEPTVLYIINTSPVISISPQ